MEELPLSPEQTAWCRQMAGLAGLGGFVIDLRSGRCLWCADEVARIYGLPVADCIEMVRVDGGAAPETWRERVARTGSTLAAWEASPISRSRHGGVMTRDEP